MVSVTNEFLVDMIRQNFADKTIKTYFGKAAEKLINKVIKNEFKSIRFIKDFKKKWDASHRCYKRFVANNTEWLQKGNTSLL